MPLRPRTPERYSFANIDEVLPLPDLIAVQRDSFEWFLDRGLAETFGDISPIADFTDQLSLKLDFDPTDPDLRPPPKFSIDECKAKDITSLQRKEAATLASEPADGDPVEVDCSSEPGVVRTVS